MLLQTWITPYKTFFVVVVVVGFPFPPSISAVKENAAMLFCCEVPEIFLAYNKSRLHAVCR